MLVCLRHAIFIHRGGGAWAGGVSSRDSARPCPGGVRGTAQSTLVESPPGKKIVEKKKLENNKNQNIFPPTEPSVRLVIVVPISPPANHGKHPCLASQRPVSTGVTPSVGEQLRTTQFKRQLTHAHVLARVQHTVFLFRGRGGGAKGADSTLGVC